jgi:hypothetical protein
MSNDQIVLLSTEVDAFVEALESFELEDIGKARYEKKTNMTSSMIFYSLFSDGIHNMNISRN